ncbi:MAG: Uma2 family endonuclease [Gemmataceae bacterium]
MSAVPKRLLTPQEYLAQERRAEFKSEYYRGEMFAMAVASYEHSLAKDNLAAEIKQPLKGGPCRTVTSDLRVKVDATGLYTYPDIVIVCGQAEFEDSGVDTLLNPIAIVEVLSESAEAYDRGAKFAQYRQVSSLQEYVLVAQDKPLVERFVRQADGQWLLSEFRGLEATLEFENVPARVPLAEIYRDVTFAETPLR